MTAWIETSTGIQFDYINMKPENVVIEDIAVALSHQCRFNGHCGVFYSVAEHAVHVMQQVANYGQSDLDVLMTALLHDASEAYLSDIPKPLKPLMPEYIAFEKKLEEIIAKKYNLIFPYPAEVKKADVDMLVTEAKLFFPETYINWDLPLRSDYIAPTIKCFDPTYAQKFFLEAYDNLIRKKAYK